LIRHAATCGISTLDVFERSGSISTDSDGLGSCGNGPFLKLDECVHPIRAVAHLAQYTNRIAAAVKLGKGDTQPSALPMLTPLAT
jgi:hypothetical protein